MVRPQDPTNLRLLPPSTKQVPDCHHPLQRHQTSCLRTQSTCTCSASGVADAAERPLARHKAVATRSSRPYQTTHQPARKFVSCVTGWISRATPKSLDEIASGCPSHRVPATFPWNDDDDDDEDTVEENLHEAIEYFEGVAIEEGTKASQGSLGVTLMQIAAFIALSFVVCQLRVAVRRR